MITDAQVHIWEVDRPDRPWPKPLRNQPQLPNGFTAAEMEDCFKIGYEIKVEAGVEIKQGWCENFAKGFACASTTILNYYLSQFEE